jgi:hypothetical protein
MRLAPLTSNQSKFHLLEVDCYLENCFAHLRSKRYPTFQLPSSDMVLCCRFLYYPDYYKCFISCGSSSALDLDPTLSLDQLNYWQVLSVNGAAGRLFRHFKRFTKEICK